jgi:hypothetical protein
MLFYRATVWCDKIRGVITMPAVSAEHFKTLVHVHYAAYGVVEFGPVAAVEMHVPVQRSVSPGTVRNQCVGAHFAECSKAGLPSCKVSQCMFGLEKCPQGNHLKPIGERCRQHHERRAIPRNVALERRRR